MFIVCQIGAREHYAIPRALHASGQLAALVTDFWVSPGSAFSRLPGGRRLRDRFHADLAEAPVHAPNARILGFELKQRLAGKGGWDAIIARNALFQKLACAKHDSLITDHRSPVTLFSYSYAARDLFRFAKERGWRTVLGQIDPGPEEERIVAEERRRNPLLNSTWQPAPAAYWESWREELKLADRIIVNSEWSRQCLLKEGVAAEKIDTVPLVYGGGQLSVVGCRLSKALDAGEQHCPRFLQMHGSRVEQGATKRSTDHGPRTTDNLFHLLFLGQIILRKGVGRLFDAMRLLKDEPVELILAGPSEIDPAAWADLPNVRWLGPVPRSEVGRIYQEADLFILPTLSDGYALTQLEALSHGLPVIASKHCGEAVTHGRNGWILDDLEPETIAAAIRVAMHEHPQDVRPPEFSLEDLAAALMGRDGPPGRPT